MASVSKLKRVADGMPQYPGRKKAEEAIRPIVEFVAGGWVRREAGKQVVRLVGFHALWHEMRKQGYKRPGVELERRGAMKSSAIYDSRRDFEIVFGVSVEDATFEEVLAAAVGTRPED